MARKKDIVYSFLSAVEKEARRSAKENERQQRQRYRQIAKEQEKQYTLDKNKQSAINATEEAVSIQAEIPFVEYLTLRNNDYYGMPDNTLILLDAINYLKLGKRVEAIHVYKEKSELSYNEIIETIRYLEANLNDIIRDNKSCWFEDAIGKHEFCGLQELIKYRQLNNYDKIEIELSCEPINIKEIVSSKNPSVIKNKSQTAVKKIAKNWSKSLNKYHAKRENNIIKEIYRQLDNILQDEACFNEMPFSLESLKDNSLFESKLEIVNKPILPESNEKKIVTLSKIISDLKNSEFDKNSYGLNFFEKLLKFIRLQSQSQKFYQSRITKLKNKWEQDKNQNLKQKETELNALIKQDQDNQYKYEQELGAFNQYKQNVQKEKELFITSQKEFNEKVDELILKFNNKDVDTVENFFEQCLEQSVYPVLFYKDYSITYNNINNILEINYTLPNIDDIFNIKSIIQNPSKDDFKINYNTEKVQSEIYDNVIYQICFKSINEVFKADKNDFVECIVFNGYSKNIDKRDGLEKTVCIMSLQISKEDFNNINLSRINAKTCFKSFKGISAPELVTLTPVRPIIQLDKNDSRFVESYDVMDYVEDGYNLATMDWQDFENLVREIFEKEFSQNGGEVRVTQASRDGGVDAIAFDPDPIRGGKIVIQAKRYTNIVGVANVRDLYGTVITEGAIKGILVTTADFGADSYEFVKDKPITLLNGANLLHLLEQHGHKAKIDLKEAKIFNNEPKTKYYINDNMQAQSEAYFIHKEGCYWLENLTYSSTYLGEFTNPTDAMKKAKITTEYEPIEYCSHCIGNVIELNK